MYLTYYLVFYNKIEKRATSSLKSTPIQDIQSDNITKSNWIKHVIQKLYNMKNIKKVTTFLIRDEIKMMILVALKEMHTIEVNIVS